MATPTTATSSGSTNSGSLPFDTVLRGYERRQVDEYVAKAKDEIAKLKLPDLTAKDLEAARKSIMGTARSMGIDVK